MKPWPKRYHQEPETSVVIYDSETGTFHTESIENYNAHTEEPVDVDYTTNMWHFTRSSRGQQFLVGTLSRTPSSTSRWQVLAVYESRNADQRRQIDSQIQVILDSTRAA